MVWPTLKEGWKGIGSNCYYNKEFDTCAVIPTIDENGNTNPLSNCFGL